MRLRFNFILIIFVLFSSSLFIKADTLKDVFFKHFLVGTIWHGYEIGDPKLKPQNIYLEKEKELSAHEFNAITAENCMKPEYLQPQEGVFDFYESDHLINFAESNNITVIGHTLVWHHMTPNWFFEDSEGNTVSRSVLIKRLKNHIRTVMERYKGKIEYWDVVNEVIQTRKKDDGTYSAFYRNTPWYKIIGPEYIEIAYQTAHEVDPNAKLLYNDYNLDQEEKLDFALEMIKNLKDKNIPIYGLGYQAHFLLNEPTLSEIEKVFDKCRNYNLPIHITELDLSVLPFGWNHRGAIMSELSELSEELNPFPKGLPEEINKIQANRYRDIFDIFVKNRDILERVSFWGVWDGNSWRNYSPISGRTDYPLLFGRKFEKKLAYHLICETAKMEGL